LDIPKFFMPELGQVPVAEIAPPETAARITAVVWMAVELRPAARPRIDFALAAGRIADTAANRVLPFIRVAPQSNGSPSVGAGLSPAWEPQHVGRYIHGPFHTASR
jgi:hypothetical protein